MVIPEEERFRLLVEAVTDYAIYMLDPNGYVASWNAGAERAKGYSREEILGEHFSIFYTEEDRRAGLPAHALSRAAAEGRFEDEGWRVRSNGSHIWAHVLIDPIRTTDGQLLGFAKIMRDLTERKGAQEQLRRSEEKFSLLVQGVVDYAIYMLDPDGRVTNWNSGAHRIKGYLADEIVGQNFALFYTPEDVAAGVPQHALDIARREGRYEKEAAERVRKNGERFWANVVIDAVHDDRGELIGFAKITRDVTEKIKAQRELARTREAFFQSQKLESLGQLTGGIAHDFNNLLMAVLSSLEMLRKRLPDDPRSLRLLDNAVQGANRGAALTQRMLSFARRQDLVIAAVDVPHLLAGLTDLLGGTLGAAVRFSVHTHGAVRPANADANQLELVIINLAVNARDAMPIGGSITIDVSEEAIAGAEGGLAAGDYLVIALTDTGEGMDAETLARATEPFFTTKGVGRGTGLGLSMAHGFAEQVSGRLTLKSQKGKGTTAELRLPVAKTAGARAPALEAADDVAASPATNRVLLVLAVDDDALVLMNTIAMLEDLGHSVLEASNGHEALQILRERSDIDLVITDFAMPHMTGRDLALTIVRERPGLPIILATGYAELPLGTEVDAYRLAKPFGEAELKRALSRLALS
jgi:PAS domain S-box-containing protein